jgi:hypothetical protein
LAVHGEGTDPSRFLPRLAGLIKYALRHKQGIAELEPLAAATAQRLESVRAGIRLLAARGDVEIVEVQSATIRLKHGDGMVSAQLEEARTRLQALLAETWAYRAYFSRTAPESLA